MLERKVTIRDTIKSLYFTRKPEFLLRIYWCKRISTVIAVLILFILLSLLGLISNSKPSVILNNKYVQRPNYGEGSNQVELNVTLEQEDRDNSSKNAELSQPQEVIINVEERLYTQEELKEVFEKAFVYLQEKVLGNNEAADSIYEKLNFIKSIPGTSITVKWEPLDYDLIQWDGTINNLNISTEGIFTRVRVILTCQDHKSEYELPFTIMPKEPSAEDLLYKELEAKINSYAQETAENEYLELPDQIDKYKLHWKEKGRDKGVSILFMGGVVALLIWLGADKELDKQMKNRRLQMLIDYPEVINKLTLLVNAGMTVKQAWHKIAQDYSKKVSQKLIKTRYAYEEMLITCHELKLGLPENMAYEQYGRRTGLIPYIKFGSLISQNLKKGNKGFTDLLMKEALEAYKDRKEVAKRLGEEAGTKLLAPMMVMLIIIFLIIMLPAFWAFQF